MQHFGGSLALISSYRSLLIPLEGLPETLLLFSL